jgi:hypothetical protein
VRVSKCLDRFLLAEGLLGGCERHISWIGVDGSSYHSPILLQLENKNEKPLGPFKFNCV